MKRNRRLEKLERAASARLETLDSMLARVEEAAKIADEKMKLAPAVEDAHRRFMKVQVRDLSVHFDLTLRPPAPDFPAPSPGLFMVAAFVPQVACPVGVGWYRWSARSVIDILGAWVDPAAQRLGVATAMYQALVARWPSAIVTGNAGSEAAEEWLRKTGFVETLRGWEMTEISPEPSRAHTPLDYDTVRATREGGAV